MEFLQLIHTVLHCAAGQVAVSVNAVLGKLANDHPLLIMAITLLAATLVIVVARWLRNRRALTSEVALWQSRYRSLVEGSPNCIAFFDAAGRCVNMNPSGLTATGKSEVEALGTPFVELWPERFWPIARDAATMTLNGGRSAFEAECHSASGSQRTWYVVLNPLLDEHGVARGFASVWTDITERRRAEEALEENARFLQLIMDAIPTPLFYKNTEGCYLGCNSAFASLFGLTKEQILGRTIYDLAPKRLADTYHRADKALLAAGGTHCYETTIARPDGISRSVLFNKATFAHPDGSCAGLVGALLDVTDQKKAEDALRDSENRLKTMWDALQTGVMLIDPATHTIVHANAAAAAMCGWSAREIVGRLCHDCLCPTDKGECPITDLGQRVNSSEGVLTRADGEQVPIVRTVTTVTLNGREHLLESFVDVSALKQVEHDLAVERERLSVTLRSIGDGVVAVDLSGRITVLNRVAETMTGWSEHDALGRPVSDVLNIISESAGDRQHPIEDVLSTGEPAELTDDAVLVARDGTRRSIEDSCVPKRDAEGRVVGAVLVFRDVTQQRRVAEELMWAARVDAALADLSKALLHSVSLDEMSDMVLRHAQSLTGSEFGFVGYVDPATGYMISPTMTRSVWEACQVRDKDIVFKEPKGLYGWVLHNRTPMLTNNPIDDPRSEGTPPGHVPITQFLSAPAILGDRLVGTVALANPGRDYTQRDLDFVERLASVYALAVERKHAEDALRDSEERFRELFHSVNDAIFLTPIDENGLPGRFIEVNDVACRRLGYSRDELLRMSPTDVDDPDSAAAIAPLMADLLKHGQATFEANHRTKCGQIIPVEVSSHVFTLEGQRMVLSVARDITERKLAENKLRESEQQKNAILDGLKDVVVEYVDPELRIIWTNAGISEALGVDQNDAVGEHCYELVQGRKSPCPRCSAVKAVRTGKFEQGQTVTPDGREWITRSNPIRDAHGRIEGIVHVAVNVTDMRRAERALRIHTTAMNAATDQIVITDHRGRVEFVNPAFTRETGYAPADVEGRTLRVLSSGKHDREFYADLWKTVLAGNTWHGEVTNRRKDGTTYVDDMTITPIKGAAGKVEHFIAIKRNVTEKTLYQEKLDHLAHHDPLTGLPNRLLFSDRLSMKLSESRQNGQSMAIMFIDLDRFKLINDTLGHNVGDGLLKDVASRLRKTLRDVDTIARMGGDEFTLILPNIRTTEHPMRVASRVLQAFSAPFQVEGHELFISPSIGVSIYPEDGQDVETLVKNADTAMYRAKEQGRNNCQLYTKALNAKALERITLETSLRNALRRHEMMVHYQPQVDIRTGDILGVEALARWKHPELGFVPPSQFVPLAEDTGLIMPISEWMLYEVCQQNKDWQDAGLPPMVASVNISARQLEHDHLLRAVRTVLDKTGLDPSYLGIELTESMLMRNTDHSAEVLGQLKEMGVHVSVDDFGTGHSSLSYLKRLPIDSVKIDQSFVRDITINPDDAAISGAVVAMAHSLKLSVVAEGVETLEQLEFLRSLKCDMIQGYFISRPVPADELTQLLVDARGDGSQLAA